MTADRDETFMGAALGAAREALERGNFPIGAAIVVDGELVATGANSVDTDSDDTRHAEMVALARCAPAVFRAKRTTHVQLFTTMEPCAMCHEYHERSGLRTWLRPVPGRDGYRLEIVD